VAELVEAITGQAPVAASAVAGGCINQAARVQTATGALFVKWRSGSPPGFFEVEADGLRRLAETGTVRVPAVLGFRDGGACGAIAMRWIEPGPSTGSAMADAGRRLARLHGERGLDPGLARDNVIGALPQPNEARPAERWLPFFRRQRVGALASGLSPRVRRKLEAFPFERFLDEPEGGCALLHGDLWSGNLVCDADGGGWLVDPAVYAGHPEVDLAMTRLFGGFAPAFYDAYQEVAGPLDREWLDRAEVLNLYPLLVHVHLFGGGYERQVEAVLDRFGGGGAR
jgi:fructosamine-3-kinase